MVTRLAKVGNSVSARLPRSVLQDLKLSAGDEVHVTIEKRSIMLKPVRKKAGRTRMTLRELLKGMRPESKGLEVARGSSVEKELL